MDFYHDKIISVIHFIHSFNFMLVSNVHVLQAVLKHLGHFGNEAFIVDEAEFQCYQQLQKLYNSTRSAKVQCLDMLLFYLITL